MKNVDLYGRVRHAVLIDGMSSREAARVFGVDPRTIAKMLAFSFPPGYRRSQPVRRPKLDAFTGIIDQTLTKLGYRIWAIAIYLLSTNLKGVSSMKLHRDLDITQKSAWHLAHRIRESWSRESAAFSGPAEADETYFGGRRANMPRAKRKQLKGRGPAGKSAVVGVKDRITKQVLAQVIASTDAATLQSFIQKHVREGSAVYTDEHGGYRNLKGFKHEAVNHSIGEYVRGMAHTNGIESFWSMLKRAHKGTFHKISAKHLDRYVTEFAGHQNDREHDTLSIMGQVAAGLSGKQLRYGDLIAENGLNSGARA